MGWTDTLAANLKHAQQVATAAASGKKDAPGTPKSSTKQHKGEPVVDLNANSGARDPAVVEAEQSRQKDTRTNSAEQEKLHQEFMKLVASGVENRMQRLGLRNEDPRNKIINNVYGKYLGLKGGSKMLSVEEYKGLIETASKLKNLADEIDKRLPPTEAERAAFAQFANCYDFKSGNVISASIDGGSVELDDATKKERDEFYLSRASLVENLDRPAPATELLATADQVFAENDFRPYKQSGWTGDPNYKGGIDCSDFVSEFIRKSGTDGDWDSDSLYAMSGKLKRDWKGTYFTDSKSDLESAHNMMQPGDYISFGDSGGRDGHCGYMTSDGQIAQSTRGGVTKKSLDSFLRQVDRRGANFVIARRNDANVSPSNTSAPKGATVSAEAQTQTQSASTSDVIIDSNM